MRSPGSGSSTGVAERYWFTDMRGIDLPACAAHQLTNEEQSNMSGASRETEAPSRYGLPICAFRVLRKCVREFS